MKPEVATTRQTEPPARRRNANGLRRLGPIGEQRSRRRKAELGAQKHSSWDLTPPHLRRDTARPSLAMVAGETYERVGHFDEERLHPTRA